MLRALLLTLVLLTTATSAWAQTPACPDRSEDDRARHAFLVQHLTSETQRARTWTIGWTIGFSALTVGQLALIPVARSSTSEAFNHKNQPDLLIGAGASTVGLVTLLASRLTILGDGPKFLSDPCAPVSLGEEALRRSAESEALSAGPLMHVANAAFNVGVGLVLGIVFKRWQTAIMNTLVGTAVGEAKILTQPTASIDAWRRYQAGDYGQKSPAVTWELLPSHTGLTLAGAF